MGCCNRRNKLVDNINQLMREFYFRLIKHDFVISKVQEFNKSKRNYYEFWVLTKSLGIHPELSTQVSYWESAFVNYSDISLDGLLLIFLLLCQGDRLNKLEYIKYYFSSNINLSKEKDSTLIMNLSEFQKIIYVYFCCLTIIPLNIFNNLSEEDNDKYMNLKRAFNDNSLNLFTQNFIKDYVKKNFYINAGKFLEDSIDFLMNDDLIRKNIIKFKSENIEYNFSMSRELSDSNIYEEINADNNNLESKPFNIKILNKTKKLVNITWCSEGKPKIKMNKIKPKDK